MWTGISYVVFVSTPTVVLLLRPRSDQHCGQVAIKVGIKYTRPQLSCGQISVVYILFTGVCWCVWGLVCSRATHYTDELGQGHLDADGDLLAFVDGRSDELVVALGAQQVVHQPLLSVRRPGAWGQKVTLSYAITSH